MTEEELRIKNMTKGILEKMVSSLVEHRPEKSNVARFMLDYLQSHAKYTSSGLTQQEKKELEFLRMEIKKYRQLDEIKIPDNFDFDKDSNVSSSEDEDEIDPNLDKIDVIQKSTLKGGRISVSAEVYGVYLKKSDLKARNIPKKEEQINRIKASILHSFLFASLEKNDLDVVIGAMEEKRYNSGRVLIQQGDNGDSLFLVEDGQLECSVRSKRDGTEKVIKTYGPGDVFGELALLYNTPRAATIKAVTDVITWVLDRETFNLIVKDAAQKKREKFEGFLKSTEILKDLEPYELSQVADALKTATFKEGDRIIEEGSIGDVFYILEEGTCVATKVLEPGKPDVVVKEYKEGEYFGERALIKGEPRAANIIAKSEVVRLICLDKDTFRRLLGPIEDILKRNMENYNKFIPIFYMVCFNLKIIKVLFMCFKNLFYTFLYIFLRLKYTNY